MKFRKKPVVIDAIQFTRESIVECTRFISEGKPSENLTGFDSLVDLNGNFSFKIHTLEGVMHVSLGDWVIRGVKGELYPCKPDIFEATYEKVDGVSAHTVSVFEEDGTISTCIRRDD